MKLGEVWRWDGIHSKGKQTKSMKSCNGSTCKTEELNSYLLKKNLGNDIVNSAQIRINELKE